ncbi:MAG: c-type cytochrome [Saccharospirillum sp.]
MRSIPLFIHALCRRGGPLAVVFAALLLTACSQSFDGDDSEARSLNEAGRSLYQAQCASCHGASGAGGTGGPLVGCPTCTSVGSLVAKIERDMPSASNPLRGSDASNVAEYIHQAFNGASAGSVQRAIAGVATLTPQEAVYKLAFDLAGRLPTEDEVQRFTESIEGEREVVFGFMDEDYFYERLKDVFNDSFLTDAYRPVNGGRISEVYDRDLIDGDRDTDVFRHLNWSDRVLNPEGGPSFELSANYLNHFSNEALARTPLLFVEYLARNDRDFRELVSGKYTVVNPFSWYALGGDTESPNVRLVDPDGTPNNGALPLAGTPQWRTWDSVDDMNQYFDVVDLKGRDTNGRSIRVNGGLTNQYVMEAFPYDPRDIRPAQLFYTDTTGNPKTSGVPHSGVLTDLVFLTKYTAMDTNRHRHRARMVYWLFSGRDLLAIEGNRDVAALELDEADNMAVGDIDPTKTNEDCTVCHKIMDPVAEAFRHFRLDGLYQTEAELQQIRGQRPITPGVNIGWAQASAQLNQFGSSNNYSGREMQWIGEQIAQDSAYAKGISQIVISGLTGQDILGAPNPDSPEAFKGAYAQQKRLITNAASEFAASGYDIKALVYAVTKSGYYRASGVFQSSLSRDYESLGSTRLLPPHLLNQRLRMLNSGGWGVNSNGARGGSNNNSLDLRDLTDRRYLGGKDSREVFEDADVASGIIATLAEAMAVEESCDIVRNDFSMPRAERALFALVEPETDMRNPEGINRRAEALAIRRTIAHLYLAVLHEEVALDGEEVDIAFELFSGVLEQDLSSGCSNLQGAEHAWFAVLVYLLNDYRFVYG